MIEVFQNKTIKTDLWLPISQERISNLVIMSTEITLLKSQTLKIFGDIANKKARSLFLKDHFISSLSLPNFV